MMTGSNHAPYALPKNIPFKPHTDVRDGNVEYADWAIGHFISEASKHSWYSNTIFVFVADHGALEPNGSSGFGDMPYALNHIPCIIYSPVLTDAPRLFSQPGGQIDVFPTICGLLNLTYINNTMGVDLLSQTRPYMYFSADDKVSVADNASFYTWHTDGRESMYGFNNREQDILSSHRAKADSMKHYAFSMLQTTEWLLKNNHTGPVK
jgi:phosphoglycerol transferase MdoB-like AlkP superfamily enzyme